MRKRSPDHLLTLVTSTVDPPTDDARERAVWDLAHGLPCADDDVQWAWEIHQEIREREILQAFLLANADAVTLGNVLRVPAAVVDVYKRFFFDVRAFRDELHLHSWVRAYPRDVPGGTADGRQLLQIALVQGLPKLCWIFARGGTVNVTPGEVRSRALSDSYFRALSEREHPLTSAELRQTQRLMGTALRAADALSKPKREEANTNTLLIKLKHRELTTSITEERPEDAPLH